MGNQWEQKGTMDCGRNKKKEVEKYKGVEFLSGGRCGSELGEEDDLDCSEGWEDFGVVLCSSRGLCRYVVCGIMFVCLFWRLCLEVFITFTEMDNCIWSLCSLVWTVWNHVSTALEFG
ncbi:hypothetical protein RchiOBHm_Chr6g0280161 [Rosa chinensis]|uniref:Transmembrane protein n=1 Tax=Rosa chinensis TaxID=74649 RepID=A0A2P6PT92_ROSCH|nr:hypothetical protein RchiOBHm_Chr6g0280161 [Rosa chinensis]